MPRQLSPDYLGQGLHITLDDRTRPPTPNTNPPPLDQIIETTWTPFGPRPPRTFTTPSTPQILPTPVRSNHRAYYIPPQQPNTGYMGPPQAYVSAMPPPRPITLKPILDWPPLDFSAALNHTTAPSYTPTFSPESCSSTVSTGHESQPTQNPRPLTFFEIVLNPQDQPTLAPKVSAARRSRKRTPRRREIRPLRAILPKPTLPHILEGLEHGSRVGVTGGEKPVVPVRTKRKYTKRAKLASTEEKSPRGDPALEKPEGLEEGSHARRMLLESGTEAACLEQDTGGREVQSASGGFGGESAGGEEVGIQRRNDGGSWFGKVCGFRGGRLSAPLMVKGVCRVSPTREGPPAGVVAASDQVVVTLGTHESPPSDRHDGGKEKQTGGTKEGVSLLPSLETGSSSLSSGRPHRGVDQANVSGQQAGERIEGA